MQVLKFGGSSVANAENINKVVAIVQQSAQKDKTVLVVSALGGVTDLLLSAARLASIVDELYTEQLSVIEKRHLTAVMELIPVARQSSVLSAVKKQCNEIEDICNGIFLLRELSPASKDRVVCFGELMSSRIISAKLSAEGIENIWKDSRELISTDSNYGNAKVDFDTSNDLISSYFKSVSENLVILPG